MSYFNAYNCTRKPETCSEHIHVPSEYDVVEREGYIPFHMQIEQMMYAGARLRDIRAAMAESFDFDDADDELRNYSEDELGFDHKRDLDMVDVSAENNRYQEQAYQMRKSSRSKKDLVEEPREPEPKEHEPLDPEPVE